MSEFWNSEITDASWEGLKELSKEIKFVLIGGWAIYAYSKLQKSKDIDVIIDYDTLNKLGHKYKLTKNDRLRKYEIKFPKYDIDIYLPSYSDLVIPPRDIIRELNRMEGGFLVPTPEALMILKLGAAMDRGNSQKGVKDSIDILGLLFYSDLDFEKMRALLSRYNLVGYIELLTFILLNFDKRKLNFLNLNEHRYSKFKEKFEKALRNLRQ